MTGGHADSTPPYAVLFKSPEKMAAYLDAYNAVLALWQVPHEPLDLPTSYGMTHINAAGSPDLPPLVLLHGGAVNSTSWYANISALNAHFRVYAVDVINQTGLSVQAKPLKTPQDCADWLVEVLDGLGLDRVCVVGHSYGGWLSLNLAMTAPQYVERMVLLSPAPAHSKQNWQLAVRMLLTLLIPTRRMFYWLFQWMTTMPLEGNHPLVEQLITGARCFKPGATSLPVMTVFTPGELGRITAPTLLLVGEREVVYDPGAVLEWARQSIPGVQAELLAGGGHLFPVDRAEAVNARMTAFLTKS